MCPTSTDIHMRIHSDQRWVSSSGCYLSCRRLLFDGWSSFLSDLTDTLEMEKNTGGIGKRKRRLGLENNFFSWFSYAWVSNFWIPFIERKWLGFRRSATPMTHHIKYGASHNFSTINVRREKKKIRSLSLAHNFLNVKNNWVWCYNNFPFIPCLFSSYLLFVSFLSLISRIESNSN